MHAIVDEEAELDPELFMERACETSYHSNHAKKCGAPAQYFISGLDVVCHNRRGGYLCGPCVPSIMGRARTGDWCPCEHAGHYWLNIRIQGIGL